MIYLYLFGTCFHFIYVFMIIGKKHIKKQWIYINMLGIIKKYNEEIDFSYCHL